MTPGGDTYSVLHVPTARLGADVARDDARRCGCRVLAAGTTEPPTVPPSFGVAVRPVRGGGYAHPPHVGRTAAVAPRPWAFVRASQVQPKGERHVNGATEGSVLGAPKATARSGTTGLRGPALPGREVLNVQRTEFRQDGRWYHGRVVTQSQVKTARLRAAAWLMEQASWATGIQRLVLRRRALRAWRLANWPWSQHG